MKLQLSSATSLALSSLDSVSSISGLAPGIHVPLPGLSEIQCCPCPKPEPEHEAKIAASMVHEVQPLAAKLDEELQRNQTVVGYQYVCPSAPLPFRPLPTQLIRPFSPPQTTYPPSLQRHSPALHSHLFTRPRPAERHRLHPSRLQHSRYRRPRAYKPTNNRNRLSMQDVLPGLRVR